MEVTFTKVAGRRYLMTVVREASERSQGGGRRREATGALSGQRRR
jgi:hypothetical protein